MLRDVSLTIEAGTVAGLVGESGSGKSTLAYAIVRYLSSNATVLAGRIGFDGIDLLSLPSNELRLLRGQGIGMVFQDPATALNPTLRLGVQLVEGLRHHEGLSSKAARERGLELLRVVHLPDPRAMFRRFPHEVSGGEKQRVLIAMAFACRPRLLVFDEPTTALGATTAAGILDLIRQLQAETGIAALYITHDLGNVAQVAQQVNVIYVGQIVEAGDVADVLERSRHPYTRMLIASVPNPYRGERSRALPTFAGPAPDLHHTSRGCIFRSRCPFVEDQCLTGEVRLTDHGGRRVACIRVQDTMGRPLTAGQPIAAGGATGRAAPDAVLFEFAGIEVHYGRDHVLDRVLRARSRRVRAVAGVEIAIREGQTVGLVGESGCGKSTLARAALGLVPFRGTVRMQGREISNAGQMTPDYRRSIQIVFQHPDLSLNPRLSVGELVGRPIRLYERIRGKALEHRVDGLLERVHLPAGTGRRRPHELSGGEKQRVAIARAFGPKPRLVICDEITSGLDVSVQASILNLLLELQREYRTAYLFISHDLNLVQHIADEIVVMYLGRVVERRTSRGEVLMPPYHPYTEALLSAVPVPEPTLRARRVRLEGALPGPAGPSAGCCFSTRCPRKLGRICDESQPPLAEARRGHELACHIGAQELREVAPIWYRVESGTALS